MFPLNRKWARRLPRLNAIHRLVVVRVARWLRRQMVLDSPGGYDLVLYVKLGDWLEVQEESKGKGIMVTGFARVSGLIACLLACCCFCQAQEKAAAAGSPDRVKVSVAFSNSEYYDLFSTEYQQGLTAELDARVFKRSGIRLGGVFQFNRANLSATAPLDTYSGGPQFSIDLARGFVSPFGRALFGYRTSYGGDRVFTRAYGLGVDLN